MDAHARDIKITTIPIFTQLIRRFSTATGRCADEIIGKGGYCMSTQPFRPFTRVNVFPDDIPDETETVENNPIL